MQSPNSLLSALQELSNSHLLQAPFTKIRTEQPGRLYCMITHGWITEQGSNMPREVIVKTFCDGSETLDKKAVQRTYREISAWVALSHSAKLCENINRFCGVLAADFDLIEDLTPGVPSIVTDFVRFESIEYTQGKDFGVRLNIVQQLANGLRYMHSMNLVHGDVKPDNFRVTEDGIVKIIDLGLSRYQTTTRTGFTTAILPCYRFIAPELIQQNIGAVRMLVTKTTDVYAFSMTALQILDGQGYMSMPFNHCKVPFAVRLAVSKNDWPRVQNYLGVTPPAWKVISACWTSSPLIRPQIDTIIEGLVAI